MKNHGLFWCGVLMVVAMGQGVVWATGPYPRRTPVVEAFEKNKDAVVSLASKQVVQRRDDFFSWGGDDHFPHFRRPQSLTLSSLGSGFVIDERGYIITNAHVVDEAVEITVITAGDSRQYQARKIDCDSSSDLAVLKIETESPLATVTLGCSDDLMIGETVLAIGNPFGYHHTLTDGIVSAVNRDLRFDENTVFSDLIQISAPINPGNSGGPLLNINGELIGINTAIRKAAEGIGFAVPIHRLEEALPKMLNIEALRRIDFGVKVSDLRSREGVDLAAGRIKEGVLVNTVRAGSAAAEADLQVGDIITAVNGKGVTSAIHFCFDVLEQSASGMITFDVWRSGDGARPGGAPDEEEQQLKIHLVLRERPKPNGALLAQQLLGLKVEVLNEVSARRYDFVRELGEVAVLGVEKGSPADNAGIARGDAIVELEGAEINSLDQLGLKLELLPGGALVRMTLNRAVQRGPFIGVQQYTSTLRTRMADYEAGQNESGVGF